ncbi:MAG: hypothetical protein PHG85_03425, partial [Candidatus Altiarchaeota archaeon]|nr:hypothetical protein [Candidatus Altiarchaeota archaeon]
MTEASRVRLKSEGDSKQLEVVLSAAELRSLGSLAGRDNLGALKALAGSLPDLLSADVRGRLPPGRSLNRLFSLLDDTAGKGATNAGSSVAVVVMDDAGREVYKADPKEPKLVAGLRVRVDAIKQSVRHDNQLVGIPDEQAKGVFEELDK